MTLTATQSTTTSPKPNRPLTMWWRVFLNVVFSLTGAYGLSVTLFYLLRALVGESLNVVALLNNLVHLLLLPALGLLPLALVFRRWWVGAALVVPFVIAIGNNAPLFVGAAPQPPADATELTVMTYNLLARADNFEASIAIIRERLNDHTNAFRPKPLIADLFVIVALAGRALFDRAVDIVLRHRLALGIGNGQTQPRIKGRIGRAHFRGDGDLFGELGKHL